MSTFGYLTDSGMASSLEMPSPLLLPSPAYDRSFDDLYDGLMLRLEDSITSSSDMSPVLSPLPASSDEPSLLIPHPLGFATPLSILSSSSSSLSSSIASSPILSAVQPTPVFPLAQPANARESLSFRRRKAYLNIYTPPASRVQGLPQIAASPIAPAEAHPPMIFPFSPDFVPPFDFEFMLMSLQDDDEEEAEVFSPMPPSPSSSISSPFIDSPLDSARPLLNPFRSPVIGPIPSSPSSSAYSSSDLSDLSLSSNKFDDDAHPFLDRLLAISFEDLPVRLSSPGIRRSVYHRPSSPWPQAPFFYFDSSGNEEESEGEE